MDGYRSRAPLSLTKVVRVEDNRGNCLALAPRKGLGHFHPSCTPNLLCLCLLSWPIHYWPSNNRHIELCLRQLLHSLLRGLLYMFDPTNLDFFLSSSLAYVDQCLKQSRSECKVGEGHREWSIDGVRVVQRGMLLEKRRVWLSWWLAHDFRLDLYRIQLAPRQADKPQSCNDAAGLTRTDLIFASCCVRCDRAMLMLSEWNLRTVEKAEAYQKCCTRFPQPRQVSDPIP